MLVSPPDHYNPLPGFLQAPTSPGTTIMLKLETEVGRVKHLPAPGNAQITV